LARLGEDLLLPLRRVHRLSVGPFGCCYPFVYFRSCPLSTPTLPQTVTLRQRRGFEVPGSRVNSRSGEGRRAGRAVGRWSERGVVRVSAMGSRATRLAESARE